MNARALLLFTAIASLAACGDAATSTPDAAPAVDVTDATTQDATLDTATLDTAVRDTTSADTTSADTAVRDTATPDTISADVVADVARDAAIDATPDVTPDATPRDVTSLDAPGCNGAAPSCVPGTPGGTCGDALTIATCTGTAWTCPAGMIFTTMCGCVGRPPGACVCGPGGWICDAGTADVADSGLLDCNPAHVACDRIPPVCTGGGEVPSVSGACWGPCVVYTRCAPIACDPAAVGACPINLVCYRTTRTCGPPL
jgi:hypothetical protein